MSHLASIRYRLGIKIFGNVPKVKGDYKLGAIALNKPD